MKIDEVFLSVDFPPPEIMHEGWGEKESGQKIFGHYNWKKRWFRLTQKGHLVLFSYYV